MKNFQDILVQNQQIVANPYIYTTPQVQKQLQLGAMGKISKLIMGTTIAHIITAPLQTIVTSMQLSILPHKDLFATVQSRTKQLSKLNTQLTISQKRNLELMLRTGGQFQPYVAPVYTGYQQAFRNTLKQGWQALFKGLGLRIIHTFPHFLCYGTFFKYLQENDSTKTYGFASFIFKCYALLAATDMSLNMFHVMENRYILQNNIKEFRVFRNVFKVLSKIITRGQMLKGVAYHSISTLFEIALKFPALLVVFTAQKFTTTTMGLYYLSQVLVYPFSTAYKRYVCQVLLHLYKKSPAIPGMIPVRYSSIGHALKVIAFEEKIKGLYRGFGLHSVSVFARMAILQVVFQNVDIQEKGEF